MLVKLRGLYGKKKTAHKDVTQKQILTARLMQNWSIFGQMKNLVLECPCKTRTTHFKGSLLLAICHLWDEKNHHLQEMCNKMITAATDLSVSPVTDEQPRHLIPLLLAGVVQRSVSIFILPGHY